jgi:hydroxymethylpyrimidine/phosphomethylpyrimidine kinase
MTISAIGCHALTVITALTVQDTIGVNKILLFDSNWVNEQAHALLEDITVDVFKIGMLGNIGNIEAIANILGKYPDVPLVFDPVLASGRGDAFTDKAMITAIRELLLPRTTVLTPNSIEARRLTAKPREDESSISLSTCAQRLIEFGCQYALLTGTHEDTLQVTNELYNKHGPIRSDSWERLPGSYHGSGCTLASAVAAHLARGLDIEEAVHKAQEYTWQTLAAGFLPGKGQYIPDRFFRTRHQ